MLPCSVLVTSGSCTSEKLSTHHLHWPPCRPTGRTLHILHLYSHEPLVRQQSAVDTLPRARTHYSIDRTAGERPIVLRPLSIASKSGAVVELLLPPSCLKSKLRHHQTANLHTVPLTYDIRDKTAAIHPAPHTYIQTSHTYWYTKSAASSWSALWLPAGQSSSSSSSRLNNMVDACNDPPPPTYV